MTVGKNESGFVRRFIFKNLLKIYQIFQSPEQRTRCGESYNRAVNSTNVLLMLNC